MKKVFAPLRDVAIFDVFFAIKPIKHHMTMKTNSHILSEPIMKKTALISTLVLSGAFITANAATVFETTTGGNAAALAGDGAGTTTALTLSPADGGGTINLATSGVFTTFTSSSGVETLGMDGNSMGVGNELWGGPSQGWGFSLDQTVDFLEFSFIYNRNSIFELESAAWKNTAAASGDRWTFSSDASTGTFRMTMNKGTGVTGTVFDLSTAGVASVAANTQVSLVRVGGDSGSGLASFTITPIPEPSTALLGGLGAMALLRRRR